MAPVFSMNKVQQWQETLQAFETAVIRARHQERIKNEGQKPVADIVPCG